jgi:NADPH:quinone reductase-like Zn-dependent oxidoreductase
VVIDYAREDVNRTLRRYEPSGADVVIDLIGEPVMAGSLSLAKTGGRLVSTVGQPDATLAASRSIRASSMFTEGNGSQLEEIGRLIEEGKVRSPRIEEFDLSEAARAQRKSESHHAEGKLVLKVR